MFFVQSTNKLEDITFYNEICWESLDAVTRQVMSTVSLSVNSFK